MTGAGRPLPPTPRLQVFLALLGLQNLVAAWVVTGEAVAIHAPIAMGAFLWLGLLRRSSAARARPVRPARR